MKSLLFAAAILATPAMVHAAAPMSAASYVQKAGASDQYERDSSRLILASTDDLKLRTFANTMIADHTKSTRMVKAAAKQAGIAAPPPMLDATGRRDMAALRAASGTARARLYIAQQKAMHRKALSLQRNYAAHGTVPALRRAAAKIVPVVESHIRMLSPM